MAEKKFSMPQTLPVLPVRDTVLFPGAVLPLTVGRESSLALVNALEGEEKRAQARVDGGRAAEADAAGGRIIPVEVRHGMFPLWRPAAARTTPRWSAARCSA